MPPIHMNKAEANEIQILTRRIQYLNLKNFKWAPKEELKKYSDVESGEIFMRGLEDIYTDTEH